MSQQRHLPEELRELADPAYDRLWKEARRKYQSAGGVGKRVTVKLEKLRKEECEKLLTLLPEHYRQIKPGGQLNVLLLELEQELAKHPYYIPSFREWFRLLDGEPLLTRREQEEQADRTWEELFSFVRNASDRVTPETAGDQLFYPEAVRAWLIRLRDGQAAGYRTLKDMLRTKPDIARTALKECADALAALDAEQAGAASMGYSDAGIRLPVLANEYTGDPHGFDWKERRGRLLYYGLLEIWGGGSEPSEGLKERESGPDIDDTMKRTALEQELEWLAAISGDAIEPAAGQTSDRQPEEIEWQDRHTLDIRSVYRRAGIRDDDVSSQALVWGAPFAEERAASLTLQQVEAWTVWPMAASVYLVENPSVFSSLIDVSSALKCKEEHRNSMRTMRLLVCLSGQPSAAAVLLLDRLHKRLAPACRFYYSGDYDVNGLAIAHGIAARYAGRFSPWRMDRGTYDQYVRPKASFSEKEKARLRQLQPAWEPLLGQHVADRGYKCYQESLLPELIQDWIKT
ncbi:TIGR02679 domain-containing protein [Paenibacillus sp. MZ04-78.2]|uniref:TIGR02679 domain-containing protein n=1 Tax=Paenibacillus sp. MZ04-78.2 TaxID=2962034 RepID=UPI0020B8EB7B|nr:TIGR02679 domain-containing protein [Paenibacillus sp. MZ04-78.2]MCP3776013.1 TIGR02679 domain-containing protein [Paenibacillus sp. MZ04-78.2]